MRFHVLVLPLCLQTMPSLNANNDIGIADGVDLENLFATQESSGSEDTAMMALMAKQMQGSYLAVHTMRLAVFAPPMTCPSAAAEKKAKVRDAKLVQAFKNETTKIITGRAEELQNLISEL